MPMAKNEMKSFWVSLLVRATLPLGTSWVRKQEAAILRDGRPLSEWETMWAHDVGVRRPEDVRILPVPRIPTQGIGFFRMLNNLFGFLSEGPTGMAVNYGIYLEASQATNPSLLVHELTHVAQYDHGQLRGSSTGEMEVSKPGETAEMEAEGAALAGLMALRAADQNKPEDQVISDNEHPIGRGMRPENQPMKQFMREGVPDKGVIFRQEAEGE